MLARKLAFNLTRGLPRVATRFLAHSAVRNNANSSIWTPHWADSLDSSPFLSILGFNAIRKQLILPRPSHQYQEEPRVGSFTNQHSYGADPQLTGLDDVQKSAVTASPNSVLQIMGSPGTGKSTVIGHRAAWLSRNYSIDPQDIVLISSTPQSTQDLVSKTSSTLSFTFGTLQHICFRYIGKFHKESAVSPNCTFLNNTQQFRLISSILSSPDLADIGERQGYTSHNSDRTNRDFQLGARFSSDRLVFPLVDTPIACEVINYIKSSGVPIYEWLQTPQAKSNPFLSAILKEYDSQLKKLNVLDLNDILFSAIHLFRLHPHLVHNIQHILVDSFESMSALEYEALDALARSGKHITVAGDPDQSIHLFDNPQSDIFRRMRQEHPDYQRVILTQNHRSTESIVKLSQQVIGFHPMSQSSNKDTVAVHKEVARQHAMGPVTITFVTFEAETRAVAAAIKYLTSRYGSALKYSDFALLDRYAHSSRTLGMMKRALEYEEIPYTVIDRHSFWQEREVESILSTFRAIQSDTRQDAIVESMISLNLALPPSDVSRMMKFALAPTFFEKLVACGRGDIHRSLFSVSPSAKEQVQKYVAFITRCRSILTLAKGLEPDSDKVRAVLGKLFDTVIYGHEEGLWKNMESGAHDHAKRSMAVLRRRFLSVLTTLDPELLVHDDEGAIDYLTTFLRLQALDYVSGPEEWSALYPEDKVVIATAYEAKGRGWPVVFLMKFGESVLQDQGDYDEALRKFYVSFSCASAACFLLADFPSHWAGFVSHSGRPDPVYPVAASTSAASLERLDHFPPQHFVNFPDFKRIFKAGVFEQTAELKSELRASKANKVLEDEFDGKMNIARQIDFKGGEIMAEKLKRFS